MQLPKTNPSRGLSRYSALSGRIATILKIFSDGKPHKAAELAQIIGVNSRTIRRTLHLMRDEIGIPLVTSRDGFHLQNNSAETGGEESSRMILAAPGTESIHSRLWPVAATIPPQRN